MNKLYIVLIAAFMLFNACSSPVVKSSSNYKTVFIKGSSDNKLEVLDWGGTGAAILFLAGLGGTGHSFDDFAPRFTDKFHVYGLTRRGFGASGQPASGYSERALTDDMLAVTDSLHISKVILIGHSIAGEEISKFASSYPDRVSKVVYLEAAYDRTSAGAKEVMDIAIQTPEPTAKDSSSFARWQSFTSKMYGFSFPGDELKQIAVFSKEGKYLREVTPDAVTAAFISGAERPNYKQILCPALAIYANYRSVTEVIPYYDELDALNKKKANALLLLLQKYSMAEQARFKNQVRNGVIKSINDANHYIFISNPAKTEKMIRDFLQ